MKIKQNSILLFLITLLTMGCKNSEKKNSEQEFEHSDSYILINDWPNLPKNIAFGEPTGLAMDSNNNIVVFHRGGRPWSFPTPKDKIESNTLLIIENETGEVLKNWGADLFLMPHGIEVDQENNIWVTDTGLQQILKFNSDGELLMTLGEASVLGNDSLHFGLPTDVTVAPDGSFYVSDGYGNSRVVKFSKDGSFLFEWGKNGPDRKLNKGNKEGEFNIPHGIDIDKNGNVYVADRENKRIQKFDSEGNFIISWQNETVDKFFSLVIDHKNERLFGIAKLPSNDSIPLGSNIFRFDLDLNLELQFGRTGFYDGPVSKYHDIVIDKEGNIFVADLNNNTIQKFRLIKAD